MFRGISDGSLEVLQRIERAGQVQLTPALEEMIARRG
jgi:hypothetical protein